MKKSDLKTGMRVVHGKHPSGPITGIVICDMGLVVFDGVNGGYNYLDNYTTQLLGSNSVWDITEVYDVDLNEVLNPNKKKKLIWKREEKSESQKQLDNVIAKLAELQKEAEQLQETIKKEKN